MLLAELNVRHTRRHMPTRRVALDDGYLPTSGARMGAVLLGAVVAEHVAELDEEQFDALDRLIETARAAGSTVPRLALRYRLQTDTHGLDRSRHRIVAPDVEDGHLLPVLELDRHGPPAPQVLGAVMAAAWLPAAGRRPAFRCDRRGAGPGPGSSPKDSKSVASSTGPPRCHRPLRARPRGPRGLRGVARCARRSSVGPWRCSVSGPEWSSSAMTCSAGSGGSSAWPTPTTARAATGAAERIAELAEAREVLLDDASAAGRSAG